MKIKMKTTTLKTRKSIWMKINFKNISLTEVNQNQTISFFIEINSQRK